MTSCDVTSLSAFSCQAIIRTNAGILLIRNMAANFIEVCLVPPILRIYAPLNWPIIVSGNELSPVRRQAITCNNDYLLSVWSSGTNFSEHLIEIKVFVLKKIRLNMSSAKWWPFCIGLNVLSAMQLPAPMPRSHQLGTNGQTNMHQNTHLINGNRHLKIRL